MGNLCFFFYQKFKQTAFNWNRFFYNNVKVLMSLLISLMNHSKKKLLTPNKNSVFCLVCASLIAILSLSGWDCVMRRDPFVPVDHEGAAAGLFKHFLPAWRKHFVLLFHTEVWVGPPQRDHHRQRRRHRPGTGRSSERASDWKMMRRSVHIANFIMREFKWEVFSTDYTFVFKQ